MSPHIVLELSSLFNSFLSLFTIIILYLQRRERSWHWSLTLEKEHNSLTFEEKRYFLKGKREREKRKKSQFLWQHKGNLNSLFANMSFVEPEILTPNPNLNPILKYGRNPLAAMDVVQFRTNDINLLWLLFRSVIVTTHSALILLLIFAPLEVEEKREEEELGIFLVSSYVVIFLLVSQNEVEQRIPNQFSSSEN